MNECKILSCIISGSKEPKLTLPGCETDADIPILFAYSHIHAHIRR